MPVSYSVDPIRNRIVTTGSGRVTAEDFVRLREERRNDPAVIPQMDMLVDLRAVEEYALPGADVHRLAQGDPEDEPAVPGIRIAIVTASTVGFGLARMYELLRSAEPEDIEVFADLDEALAWLDGVSDGRDRAAGARS